jgi:excisionase family DNA binding protein
LKSVNIAPKSTCTTLQWVFSVYLLLEYLQNKILGMNDKITNESLQEEWLSSDEAAEFLKVSKKTLKRYRDSGKLPFSKDARKIRYKKSDIVKYLNKYYQTTELKKENDKMNIVILYGVKNG